MTAAKAVEVVAAAAVATKAAAAAAASRVRARTSSRLSRMCLQVSRLLPLYHS